MTARFVRLAETARSPITLEIDGDPVQALQGDTLLVAILCKRGRVRVSEFGDGNRAGFCLMGACQDCWVWTAEGSRMRACSTLASDGMKIVTREPQNPWSHA
jgi:predicted molibdopterin-dependent oxidoreductase YjgC